MVDKTFLSNIRSLNKFFFCKLDVRIAKDKQTHFKNQFYADVSQ